MKHVSCNDILSLNTDEQQQIINEVRNLMNNQYPDFVDWFNNKLIPGISNQERNIIFIKSNDEIIGFVNLTNKKSEKKISNIYINSFFRYKAYFNILIDKALEWLDTEKPVILLSEKELVKCCNLILNRDWHFTGMNKNGDFIVNRNFSIETVIKKKKIQ